MDDYHSAAECIQAGMYWFSQSDLPAAEAWWRRALELEPDNARAASCLRLLQKTSSTGYKQDSWARLPAASAPPRIMPAIEDPFAPPEDGDADGPTSAYEVLRSDGPSLSLDTDSLEDEENEDEDPVEPPTSPLNLDDALPSGDMLSPTSPEGPTFDLDEKKSEAPKRAAKAVPEGASQARAEGVVSPWDVGPSRTSVITIDAGGGFDAVPDPTPLPTVDRDVFFNRGDPSSRDEIVTFLRETGDLPDAEAGGDHSAYPVVEEPEEVGMDPLEALSDALSTEPATSVREVSPETALAVARDRYQLHDFQGVLDALGEYPHEESHQTEVRNMLAESRANLLKMYEAKIGPLEQVPEVLVSNEEVIWLNLNHRAGFILSQVDGTVSYDDLISLSGMPRLDTVRILTELLDQSVIGVGPG